MKLSVVLATYNEEKNIEACLKSVIGWCDEIVVVDGSSTDRTVLIAKSLGAKVYVTGNPPIFHINKQKAIDHARGEWILQLDADERVTKELRDEVLKVMEDKKLDGYWIPRKNYFLGRFLMKGGVYPDYTLRLYRRGKGKLPQKDVHEQATVTGHVGYLKQPLIHMADTTFDRYLIRFNRYTDLIATQLSLELKRPGIADLFTYFLIKPIYWFGLSYFRHKGFMDSWQGFMFSLFSSLRFPIAYIKFVRACLKTLE